MPAPINRLESMWSESEAREALATGEQADWRTRAKSVENSFEHFLAKHPKAAIVAAAAVGVALAWIVKRK